MSWLKIYLMGVMFTFCFITYMLPYSQTKNQTKLEYSIIMLIISSFSWVMLLFLFVAASIKWRD